MHKMKASMRWQRVTIAFEKLNQWIGRTLEGKDKNKDQSYFLARLTIEQLQSARFPLGETDKTKVRKMANELGLHVADKKDSQGICFLGKVKSRNFSLITSMMHPVKL